MWKILPSLVLYSFCLHSAWGNEEGYPNFDDIREVEKIKSSAVLGEWDEFSNKSLPFDEFRQIHGLQYLRTEQDSFSGCYIQVDSNQKNRNLRYFLKGLLNGPFITWAPNGRKMVQGYYKNGKKHGLCTFWSEEGIKVKEQNFNEGKLDGITNRWYQNGQKSAQQIFHNGGIVTAIGWKPDGSRCPSTRVINGAGVVVLYDDFGEEISRKEKISSRTDEAVKSIERYENGNIREEGYRINAKKDGVWIYYRPDGLEHFRIDYQEGVQKKMKFSSSILPE